MKQLIVDKIKRKFDKILSIPGSKSLSIRALILASLASNDTKIKGILLCDDTTDCINALSSLGIKMKQKKNGDLIVFGSNGIYNIKDYTDINVGSSGITCRFLLSILCANLSKQQNKVIIFNGSDQLRKRPIKPLVDSLVKLGANIKYLDKEGYLPLEIKSSKFHKQNELFVSGLLSSQYISSILIMSPLLEKKVDIHIIDINPEYHPYIKMTIKAMEDFGIKNIKFDEKNCIYSINPQSYSAKNFIVEADLNTAGYFFAIAAITNSKIKIKNINRTSLQPGILFLDILKKMDCIIEYKTNSIVLIGPEKLNGGFEINMFLTAELATLLATIATFAKKQIKIYGIKHIRNHESDRISNISKELTKAGINIQEFDDGLIINPGTAKFFTAETYDDHRIAMSLAVLGACGNGVNISNYSCVSKTCPEFFELLDFLCK